MKIAIFRRSQGLADKTPLVGACGRKRGWADGGPQKSQWWGARRLLALIGWGRARDPGPAPGEGLFSRISQVPQYLSPNQPSPDVPEHFQICFNFARHLFDLCVVTLLCACSPAFRLLLDILGFRGPLKVWLHGLATFLVTTYGMYLALWLVQKYLLQFACLYGFLQTLVLCVSIRAAEEEEESGGVRGEWTLAAGQRQRGRSDGPAHPPRTSAINHKVTSVWVCVQGPSSAHFPRGDTRLRPLALWG
ncbi:uncharacterized protein C6orf47 homolog [Lepidochelys kempii]|uniref:uncharacterized protein C6orf47 homolog n=1 Tax=Lepidochelys kempii TaxID=8472 RepID=UPI0039F43722